MTAHGFRRTPFASRLLRHAMRDRTRRETGSPDSSTSPMFDDWREGIHSWVRQQTDDYVRDRGVHLHDYVAAVNSSMVFGFNLFVPFRVHGATALDELLDRALGVPVRVVDIDFEFQGPTDVLAECAGPRPTRHEKFTASDVAIHVRDDAGRMGVVLIEVKLSEGGFTPCGGAKSSANRRQDVCASASTFFDDPSACYLRRTRHAQRDRRYWVILEAELDVRLRDNYLNLYFRGRSLARIVGRRRGPAKLEIHHKYLVADQIGGLGSAQK